MMSQGPRLELAPYDPGRGAPAAAFAGWMREIQERLQDAGWDARRIKFLNTAGCRGPLRKRFDSGEESAFDVAHELQQNGIACLAWTGGKNVLVRMRGTGPGPGGNRGTLRATAWQGLSKDKTPRDFPAATLARGTRVELEHAPDHAVAQRIAMDHLTEDPHYYEKLAKMEHSRGRSHGMKWLSRFDIDFEGRVAEVLMHKYKYTKWRAQAVITAAWGNDRGALDVLRGQDRSPSEVAEFLYCRSGPQPTGARAAMERVTGPVVKVRPGTADPNNPTRDVLHDGAFCKESGRATGRARGLANGKGLFGGTGQGAAPAMSHEPRQWSQSVYTVMQQLSYGATVADAQKWLVQKGWAASEAHYLVRDAQLKLAEEEAKVKAILGAKPGHAHGEDKLVKVKVLKIGAGHFQIFATRLRGNKSPEHLGGIDVHGNRQKASEIAARIATDLRREFPRHTVTVKGAT